MRFVDSHLHLSGPDDMRIVDFASATGTTLFACGVDRETSLRNLELSSRHLRVLIPFVGVHPSEAEKDRNPTWLEEAVEKATGIGEIGLDPTYSAVNERSAQMEVFRYQLEVAQKKRKPVQVHTRGAEKESMEVLSTFGPGSVLLHWLEDERTLPLAMDRGYYVSFSPALLYSKKLQRIASKSDPTRVLVESDSPVTYGPLGSVHGPFLVPSVAFKLSELWGEPFAETITATANRSMAYTRSSGKG